MRRVLLAFIIGLILGLLVSDRDKIKAQKILRKHIIQLQKKYKTLRL